jgi:deoxyhypusine synthase
MANDTRAAKAALFVSSEKVPGDATRIRGPDFNQPISLDDLIESYASVGFQASGLSKAIGIINRMVCVPP